MYPETAQCISSRPKEETSMMRREEQRRDMLIDQLHDVALSIRNKAILIASDHRLEATEEEKNTGIKYEETVLGAMNMSNGRLEDLLNFMRYTDSHLE